jgi:hypothetical protein
MKSLFPHPTAFALAGALLLSLGSVGCGNDSQLEAKSAYDQGKGDKHIYEAGFDQAWQAAHVALQWNQVGAATDHTDHHYVITDPTHFDQIGIWVEPDNAQKTRVTVVVIDDPNLPGPNEAAVQKDIATALSLIAAGKPTDKRPAP